MYIMFELPRKMVTLKLSKANKAKYIANTHNLRSTVQSEFAAVFISLDWTKCEDTIDNTARQI